MNKFNFKKIWKILPFLLLIVLFFTAFEVQIGEEPSQTYPDDNGQARVEQEEPEEAEVPDIIPTGTPEVYGDELDVSYDDVSPDNPRLADETIEDLAEYDQQIELEGEELDRYIHILYEKEDGISCEYCCGAQSIIFPDGEPACGCAHSFAMRGVAKYLISEHGEEFTDEEILEEAGKWKVLFFPDQHMEKASTLEEKGAEVDYINLAANTYRGIEERSAGGGGGMVGGC